MWTMIRRQVFKEETDNENFTLVQLHCVLNYSFTAIVLYKAFIFDQIMTFTLCLVYIQTNLQLINKQVKIH